MIKTMLCFTVFEFVTKLKCPAVVIVLSFYFDDDGDKSDRNVSYVCEMKKNNSMDNTAI